MFRPLYTIVALSVLTACGGADRTGTAAAGEPGGTLVIAAPEPGNLLPPLAQTAQDRAITDNVYDRLAEIGDRMNTIGDDGFTPRLAESWDWAPDSMSITFHLDPDARWHDGERVTAEDVRLSFDLYRDPAVSSFIASLLSNIDSVTVSDSLTAVAWYHEHRPEQFYDLVFNVFIMPSHLLKDIPPAQLKTSELTRAPIGTGRFRFVRWEPGTRLELVSDTANYRGRARLDRVILTPVADFNAGITQLMSGQADMFENLTTDQIAKVDSSPTVRAMPYPSFQYVFMGLNLNDPDALGRPHPIFGNRETRRALSMAVDRQAMLQNVFGNMGQLGYGPFPATLASADTTLNEIPYDTTRAGAILDSLGWKLGPDGIRSRNGRPLAFRMLVPTSSRARMSYAVLLQQQFRNIGARVDIDALEFNTFFARQNSRQFDAVLAGYNTDPSPAGAKQAWGSSGIGRDGANIVGYSSPQFDALLDSALASFDPEMSADYAGRAYQVAINDAPGIWLYDVLTVAGVARRFNVTGLRPDGWWLGLADWTVPADKRIPRDRIGVSVTPR